MSLEETSVSLRPEPASPSPDRLIQAALKTTPVHQGPVLYALHTALDTAPQGGVLCDKQNTTLVSGPCGKEHYAN